MTDVADRVERVKARYENCFGCGRANVIGLQLGGFALENQTVTATFRPRPEYRGFDGILHGGIIATALDELLGWTAILLADAMAVTAKLDLRYRSPGPADGDYRLEGRVDDRRGKRLLMSGICTADGKVIAEASGIFLVTGRIPSNPSQ